LPGIDDSAVLDRHRTAMRSGVLEALSVMVPPACAPRSVPEPTGSPGHCRPCHCYGQQPVLPKRSRRRPTSPHGLGKLWPRTLPLPQGVRV